MDKVSGPLGLVVHGEKMVVPDIEHWHCPRCGETITDFANTGRLQEGAHARYREKHDLLAGEEIRAIRQRHRLTPLALARLLHIRRTQLVERWEDERAVQSADQDLILRFLRDLPGAVQLMRKRAA